MAKDVTVQFVIEMLGRVCGHDYQSALRMAFEVDSFGRVIVMTGMLYLVKRKVWSGIH